MPDFLYLLLLICNSLLVGCLGAALAVAGALGLLLASLAVGGKIGRLPICLSGAFLMVPTYALAGAWGTVGLTGGWLSISPADVAGSPIRALAAVAWIHGVAKMPLVLLCLVVALQRIGVQLLEQSLVERSWFATLRIILIPLLRPWIVFAWLACVMLIHADMVISNLYQVETLTERVYKNESLGQQETLTTLVCLLLAITIASLTTWVAIKCMASLKRSQSGSQSWWAFRQQTLVLRFSSLCLAVLLLVAFVALPLHQLIYKSGFVLPEQSIQATASRVSDFKPSFSFSRSLASIIEAPLEFQEELQWTLQLSFWSMLVGLIASVLIVRWCGRSYRLGITVAILVFSMLAIPGPIINRLAFFLFNREGDFFSAIYEDSLIPCIFCLQFRVLPMMLLVLWPASLAMSSRYGDAWKVEMEHQPWQLAKAWLAAMIGPLAIAAFVGFVVACGDLSSYLLVLPPGVTTLAMRIFDLLHYAVRYRDAGLLVCITLLSMGLSFWGMRRFVI